MLYVRPNNLGHARLGIVVAKRFAPRAVTRNLVKRLSRELFRKANMGAVDCIVRLSKPLVSRQDSASSRALRHAASAELTRLLHCPHTAR